MCVRIIVHEETVKKCSIVYQLSNMKVELLVHVYKVTRILVILLDLS